jgi:hypothetical protein
MEANTMKRICLILLAVFSFAVPSFAGKVYGNISESGKTVPKDVKVEVTCGANSVTATTDATGNYSVFVADKGKCSLKVHYQNQMPALEITSFESSVQYDLTLEKQGTQYTLRRK